ncbi:unknown [Prevotella sp. CAG:386]|nr:unknown [Prevotella sp. CAG:386]
MKLSAESYRILEIYCIFAAVIKNVRYFTKLSVESYRILEIYCIFAAVITFNKR